MVIPSAFPLVLQPAPLPSAPVSLPNLGPSDAQLNLSSSLAIGLVIFGAGLLAQRVWLLDARLGTTARGRGIAMVGIICLALGSAATWWWATLIDINAAWTQAWWVISGSTITILATVATVVVPRERRLAGSVANLAVSVGASIAVVGFVYLGHARTAEPTAVALASDLAHLVCAAVWTGGVGVVAISSFGKGIVTGSAVTELLRRFSGLAAAAVGVLAISGLVLGVRIAGSLDQVFVGDRGALLMVKLLLAWTAVVLAATNGLVFAPKARRSGSWGAVSRTSAIEMAVLFSVLVAAALLSNEPPQVH